MRGKRITAALLILAVPFIGAAECKRKVPSDRPPAEREVDPATARTVNIYANCFDGEPYEIVVDAYDDRGGHEGWTDAIAGGEYQQTLDYSSGIRVRIEFQLKAGHRGQRCEARISDGRYNQDEGRTYEGPHGPYIRLRLTTAR